MNSTCSLTTLNCTDSQQDGDLPRWTYHLIHLPAGLSAIHIAILILVAVSNTLVLIVLSRIKKLSIQHCIMVGICVGDLMTVIPQCTSAVVLLNGGILLKKTWCDTWGIISMATFEITVWLHVSLSVEKCLSVTLPLVHRRWSNKKLCKPLIVTMLVLCIVLPVFISSMLLLAKDISIYFEPTFPLCFVSAERSTLGSAVIAGLFGFIPVLIQLITNTMIFHRIRKTRNIARYRIIRAVKTLVVTLGLYYVCWAPILLAIMWRKLTATEPPVAYTLIAYQFLMLNSGMSFFIYAFTLPGFKLSSLANIIRRRHNRVQVIPMNRARRGTVA